MARPELSAHRRQAASRSRTSLALARIALRDYDLEAATRLLGLPEGFYHEVARTAGSETAARELIATLVVGAGLPPHLGADGHDEPQRRPPDQGDSAAKPTAGAAWVEEEATPEWVALGMEIGFLPVFDDLAVIAHDTRTTDSGDLVEAVHRVVAGLESAGHQHSAIAVAAIHLPDDVDEAIFEAGAQLLVVAPEFLDMDDAGRMAWLRPILADFPSEQRAVVLPGRDEDDGLYDQPSLELTAEQIEEWERTVEQSDEAD